MQFWSLGEEQMIGTVIKLCRVLKAVPKGIMFWGFPSAVLVNVTSWQCSKGISSELAQTSTWTEGWMFKNLGVFVHDHKKKNNSNVCSGFCSRFTPQMSSWRNSYSSRQTRFHHRTLQHLLAPNLVYLFSTDQKTVVAGTLTVYAEPRTTNALPRSLKSQ